MKAPNNTPNGIDSDPEIDSELVQTIVRAASSSSPEILVPSTQMDAVDLTTIDDAIEAAQRTTAFLNAAQRESDETVQSLKNDRDADLLDMERRLQNLERSFPRIRAQLTKDLEASRKVQRDFGKLRKDLEWTRRSVEGRCEALDDEFDIMKENVTTLFKMRVAHNRKMKGIQELGENLTHQDCALDNRLDRLETELLLQTGGPSSKKRPAPDSRIPVSRKRAALRKQPDSDSDDDEDRRLHLCALLLLVPANGDTISYYIPESLLDKQRPAVRIALEHYDRVSADKLEACYVGILKEFLVASEVRPEYNARIADGLSRIYLHRS